MIHYPHLFLFNASSGSGSSTSGGTILDIVIIGGVLDVFSSALFQDCNSAVAQKIYGRLHTAYIVADIQKIIFHPSVVLYRQRETILKIFVL